MTVETLITECRRIQEVLDNYYLGDLDPVVHLSYWEAAEIYRDWDIDTWSLRDGEPLTPPVPGTFWYNCFGIRIFVERVEH